jgi:hypothetical protein
MNGTIIEIVIDHWFSKVPTEIVYLNPFRNSKDISRAYGKTIVDNCKAFLSLEQQAVLKKPSSSSSSSLSSSSLSSLSSPLVELGEKQYSGQEPLEELLNDISQLIENDRPSRAVTVYRLAKKHIEAKGDSFKCDPRVAAAALCERELVAVLEDMSNDEIWVHHGTSRGTTVHLDKTSTGNLRFRVEGIINVDIFSAVATMNEVNSVSVL